MNIFELPYLLKYHWRLRQLRTRWATRLLPQKSIDPPDDLDTIWNTLVKKAPPGITFKTVSLASEPIRSNLSRYWNRFSRHYSAVGNPREKALEHALMFELMDFSKVRRYCDVASSKSPVAAVFAEAHPRIEFWKQDLVFKTDLSSRTIGGLAQDMKDIESGFFDILGLHCSFEHFEGASDRQFVQEANRILSPSGACLILPLYMGEEHRIYFDPTCIDNDRIAQFDKEARLSPTLRFRQEHGRFYHPASFIRRILSQLPDGLRATVIRFTDHSALDPSLYLRFALMLRKTSQD